MTRGMPPMRMLGGMPKPTIEELAEHAGENQCQSRHRNGSRCIRPAGHYAVFTEADDTQRRIGRKHRGGPRGGLFWEDNEAMTEPTTKTRRPGEPEPINLTAWKLATGPHDCCEEAQVYKPGEWTRHYAECPQACPMFTYMFGHKEGMPCLMTAGHPRLSEEQAHYVLGVPDPALPPELVEERAIAAEKEARHARRDEIREIMREMLDEMLYEREDRIRQDEEARREERGRYERAAAIQHAIETLEQASSTSIPVDDWVLQVADRYATFVATGRIDDKEQTGDDDQGSAETIAKAFHDAYETLAPAHGYRTREASAKPWDEVPDNNRNLMIATVQDLIGRRVIIPARSA